jgi:hypothetical protein
LWPEVRYLSNECSESSQLAASIGIAAGLVAIFIIWIVWRGWTSKARHRVKNSAGMEALYESSKIVDVEFKDVSLSAFAIDPTLPSWGIGKQYHWNTFWYYVGCVFSLYYIWGLLSDAFAFTSLYATGRQTEAIFYVATVIISVILIGYDVFQAYHVLQLDDISDGFLNADVVRWRSLKKLPYTFFKKLGEGIKCSDQLALFLFNALINAPRLAFVEIPQLVLIIVARVKTDKALQSRCGVYLNDPNCYDVFCAQCIREHQPSELSTWGLAFKGVFLGIALYQFCFSVFLYPCVRRILQLKFAKHGGKDFTLGGYCTYLIDMRITELLIKTPNAVQPEFWDKRGKTPDGEKKSIKEQASEVRQAAIERVQETKAAAIETAQETKAAAIETVQEAKATAIAQVEETKVMIVETKQEVVDRAIGVNDNIQEKYSAGKDAVRNVFSTGRGVLNVLTKKEGDTS